MADESNVVQMSAGGPSTPAITDQDTTMADAPNTSTPTTSTPSHFRVSTPTAGRTGTPQRTGPPATAASQQPNIPAKAIPNGAKCRQYLNEKVTPVLLDGMKRVANEQPEAPLKMLGEFLLAKSKEFESS